MIFTTAEFVRVYLKYFGAQFTVYLFTTRHYPGRVYTIVRRRPSRERDGKFRSFSDVHYVKGVFYTDSDATRGANSVVFPGRKKAVCESRCPRMRCLVMTISVFLKIQRERSIQTQIYFIRIVPFCFFFLEISNAHPKNSD